ncbi:MAG TPA: vWA domain-containing protein [Vicinamibacterales bacterium]
MKHRRLLSSAACAALLCASLPAALFAQAEQRSIFVSALDQSGAPVADLQPRDVIVREDKATREVLNITPASQPMQLAVLIDNSQAAEPYIRDYRAGLTDFLNVIAGDPSGARHEVSLITLAERPTINTDYTTDIGQLTKGAQRIFSMPGSGAYLLDAIMEVCKGFKSREAARPVIVALTSEGPELSDRHYTQVLEPLRESGAAFHVVVIGRPRNNDEDRNVVLSQGTGDTGGRYDTVLASSALPSRLKQVATELTHQFRVTYARPQTLIPPEKITVASAKPGLTVRGTPMKQSREQDRR